jgi:hypothetical protein
MRCELPGANLRCQSVRKPCPPRRRGAAAPCVRTAVRTKANVSVGSGVIRCPSLAIEESLRVLQTGRIGNPWPRQASRVLKPSPIHGSEGSNASNVPTRSIPLQEVGTTFSRLSRDCDAASACTTRPPSDRNCSPVWVVHRFRSSGLPAKLKPKERGILRVRSMTFDAMDSSRATACNWTVFSISCNAPRKMGHISAYLRATDFPEFRLHLEKYLLDLGVTFALEGFPS